MEQTALPPLLVDLILIQDYTGYGIAAVNLIEYRYNLQ